MTTEASVKFAVENEQVKIKDRKVARMASTESKEKDFRVMFKF